MKPSHTTTPRTLGDAVFHSNADPIEHYEAPPTLRGLDFLMVLCCLLVIALWAFWGR